MHDDLLDDGLTDRGLWLLAWLFGITSGLGFGRLVLYARADARYEPEQLVWTALCVVAAVLTACCAVLAGLKKAESRLAARAPLVDPDDA